MLSLQQIRVLTAISEHGSLNRAADALGYGVPTILHHLNALEQHLQVAVVNRGSRGTTPTELGTLVVEEGRQVLAALDRLERKVHEFQQAGMRTLKVGTFASMGARLIPRAMRAIDAVMQVRLEVVEAEPDSVQAMLLGGEIDAGLIYDFDGSPATVPDSLTATKLLEQPYRVLVGADTPYANDAALDFARLHDAPWVLSRTKGAPSDRVLERVCRQFGYSPREVMRTDDVTMIHGLVAAGVALALSTEVAAGAAIHTPQSGGSTLRLMRTVQDLGTQRVWLLTPRGEPLGAVALLQRVLAAVVQDTADTDRDNRIHPPLPAHPPATSHPPTIGKASL